MAAAPHMTKDLLDMLARQVVGLELSPAEIDQLTPLLDRLLSDLAQIPDTELQDLEPPLFFDAGEPKG